VPSRRAVVSAVGYTSMRSTHGRQESPFMAKDRHLPGHQRGRLAAVPLSPPVAPRVAVRRVDSPVPRARNQRLSVLWSSRASSKSKKRYMTSSPFLFDFDDWRGEGRL
jgi:hypothetical protein